jgi:ABC-type amino acid transport substrate-binding protein
LPEAALRRWDWRGATWNVVAAGGLGLVAAGFFDIAAILAVFTPRAEATGAAFVVAGQIRWGAGVAAAFLVLRAAGLFKLDFIRNLMSPFRRGGAVGWALGIFVVALALRLAYAAFAEPPPISDGFHYDRLARNLAAGRGYAEDGVPTAYRPVGYPAAIAYFYLFFGPRYFPVIIFQSILGAATAMFLVLLAREFVTDAPARVAAAVIALWPSQVAYAARLFPAVILAFLVVAAAFVFVRARGLRGALGAGLLTAAAIFVAPVSMVLVAAAFACDLFRGAGMKRALARGAVVAGVAALAVAPWTYRNWRVFGAFVPVSTNGGLSLWVGNNPNATGTYYYPTSPINPLFMTEGELQRDRLGRELSWYFIRNERAQFLMLTVPKFVYTYGADVSAFQLEGIARGSEPADSARGFAARVAQTYYALVLVGFIIGLWKWRRNIVGEGTYGRAPLAALLAWPVAFTFVYVVFFGQDRFHFPMLPFIAVVAAAAFLSGKDGD